MKHLGITKRKCRPSDIDFVYRMVLPLKKYLIKFFKWDKPFFRESYRRTYKHSFILMKGSRRIGMFGVEHEKSHSYLCRIFLSPAYQKKGIGKAVMEYVEDSVMKRGIKKMRLHVWKGNQAKKFYQKLGYKTVSFDGKKYLMEKKL